MHTSANEQAVASPRTGLDAVLAGSLLSALLACGGSHSSSPAPPASQSISLYAGSAGGYGAVDGSACQTRFNGPEGLAFDSQGQLLVADAGNNVIRRVDPGTGQSSLLAGAYEESRNFDGLFSDARLPYSWGMATASNGTLVHFTDPVTGGIRTLDFQRQIVTTLLRGHGFGFGDGIGPNVSFRLPTALAMDEANGYLYVTDRLNALLRRVTVATTETITVAGTLSQEETVDGPFETAAFNYPNAVAGPVNGVVYVGCFDSVRAVNLRTRTVTTLAGRPNAPGFADGTGCQAKFHGISSMVLDGQGRLLIAEGAYSDNQCGQIIRSLDLASGRVTTLAGTGAENIGADGILRGMGGWADGTGPEARFNQPSAIVLDGRGYAYIGEYGNHIIRKMDLATNRVWTLAGTGPQVGAVDGLAPQASFNLPLGITVDPQGNVYLAEYSNNLIRRITPQGMVTTVAGKAGQGGFADGKGDAARLSVPMDLAMDPAGNLYVVDLGNDCIRKITPDGTVSLFAGNPNQRGWADGQGKAARFQQPSGIVMASDGLLYVADTANNRIRSITLDGRVGTLAGSGDFALKDGIGTAAAFGNPRGIAEDGHGRLYVADTYNQAIRTIELATGAVATMAGGSGGFVDGLGKAASFQSPFRITVDRRGFLLVADRGNNAIRRISPEGQVTTVVGRSRDGKPSLPGIVLGDLPGQITAPAGLAIALDGSLLVTADNCVLRIAIP